MRIVFLILHYQNVEYTDKCVESIRRNCPAEDCHIVIVDNASPNQSGEAFRAKYLDDEKVDILITSENLGFAKGNNVGMEYIKENIPFDFVAMINNDVEIADPDFCKTIEEKYSQYHFAVMGPKVILRDGSVDQYPFEPMSEEILMRQMRMFKLYYILCRVRLHKMVKYVTDRRKKARSRYDERSECKMNVALNGCALIFSKHYLDCFSGINPDTFMYKEEQLLYHRLQRSKMLSVYSPDTFIIHNEGVSTQSESRKQRLKMLNYYRRQLESGRVLMNYLMDLSKI